MKVRIFYFYDAVKFQNIYPYDLAMDEQND